MPFDYSSMARKLERLTSTALATGWINVQPVRARNTAVTLSNSSPEYLAPVCDWCEDNFGDDWIYEWTTFYFVNEKDAAFFALKWL